MRLIDQTILMYRGGVSGRQEVTPPGFLRLAGHPLRWRLLSELARSDRQVRELKALLGQPQNLVSYHLARLRAGGLVAARRSSADGRDAYYSLDLARCGEDLLTAADGAPWGCGSRPPARGAGAGAGEGAVLVYREQCPLADGAGAAGADGRGYGHGGQRGQCIPSRCTRAAVRVMGEHGIDISSRQSRHVNVVEGERFDYVITLCRDPAP